MRTLFYCSCNMSAVLWFGHSYDVNTDAVGIILAQQSGRGLRISGEYKTSSPHATSHLNWPGLCRAWLSLTWSWACKHGDKLLSAAHFTQLSSGTNSWRRDRAAGRYTILFNCCWSHRCLLTFSTLFRESRCFLCVSMTITITLLTH